VMHDIIKRGRGGEERGEREIERVEERYRD
jgi:hypothetical protein